MALVDGGYRSLESCEQEADIGAFLDFGLALGHQTFEVVQLAGRKTTGIAGTRTLVGSNSRDDVMVAEKAADSVKDHTGEEKNGSAKPPTIIEGDVLQEVR